jgi:DNA replication and repair protein RecF
MFSPDDVLVVKGGPEGRRRLLDLLLSQMHPHSVRQLRVFQRAVAQRNRALKGGAADAVLDSFAPALAESGAYVWARRRELIALLAPELASVAARLAPADTPALALARGGHADTDDAAGLLRELDRRRGEERARGLTLTGPHRDDLEIRLNGRSARLYGSQGQQRTLALGLKMAARTVLEHHVGIPPVVLLDDVLSELDDTRRRALLDLVAAGTQQTVVTDAQGDGYRDLAARRLLVDGGRIRDAAGEGR